MVLLYIEQHCRGSGVATYASTNLTSECVGPVNFECHFVDITFHANKHLTIANIYRAPICSFRLHEKNITVSHSELIIVGDFNSNWLHCSSSSDRNLVAGVSLTQLITEPTRVEQRSSSLLDWLLVTNPDRIIKSGVMSDCISGHSLVFCVWKIKLPIFPPKYIR